MKKILSSWGWRYDAAVLLGSLLSIMAFGLIFVYLAASSDLDTVAIRNMSSTVITANATLFGLSTLSTAVYLDVTKRSGETIRALQWNIMVIVTASFLSFITGLIGGFVAFIIPDGKSALAMSIGGTLSGAGLGSISVLSALRNHVRSQN